MTNYQIEKKPNKKNKLKRKNLQSHQIELIDEAINSIGEYGEVRIIVEKGRLRFLVTQKSFDMLKWQPGSHIQDFG